MSTEITRAPTAVDDFADKYLLDAAALDPLMATYVGMPGYDSLLPDLSPDGLAAQHALTRSTLQSLALAEPSDDVDRVTVAAMTERLSVASDLYDAGAVHSDLNNIASPIQGLRDVFTLMPTDTTDDWAAICSRMNALPETMQGYVASLQYAALRGDVAAARQVRACIGQCQAVSGVDGFFASLAREAKLGNEALPAAVRDDLDRATLQAREAFESVRTFLADDLLPQAPESDAVGLERYQLASRSFLGTTVDLEETYAWGQHELARITALMSDTADAIKPGVSVVEAMHHLDADSTRKLHGSAELQRWMQQCADEAIAALADVHFDIPDPVRTLECRIAPTNTGGIYYTGPSDDFSRPGRMWWSIPAGVSDFSTWRERTTVYHEGVPGHHLQVGQTVFRRQLLNSWRRLASWTSGHGEGWALYAEWLMADLGFMDDPGDRLGLLDGQSLRSARVVLDIGVHCGFPAPAEVGGGDWTYDKAWTFLTTHSHMAEGFLRFELDRYLGWPGQAPSYKIGERLWLALRDAAQSAAASDRVAFDLKAFHRRALDIGSVGLDVLSKSVLGQL